MICAFIDDLCMDFLSNNTWKLCIHLQCFIFHFFFHPHPRYIDGGSGGKGWGGGVKPTIFLVGEVAQPLTFVE